MSKKGDLGPGESNRTDDDFTNNQTNGHTEHDASNIGLRPASDLS